MFDRDSTADDVLEGSDLQGKRILVTGVSVGGLGGEIARTLAAHGASVVGTVRDAAVAERSLGDVRRAAAESGGEFGLVALNLADLDSVRRVSEALADREQQFDLVIANAGVMATPYGRTVDGFETQLAVNLLGHFVLANRLIAAMRPGARLITVSSNSHRFADYDLDDPNYERSDYEPWSAYARSKTGEAVLAVGFDALYRDRGTRAASVHPGLIRTNLTKDHDAEALQRSLDKMLAADAAHGLPPFVFKTIPQGAATAIWAGLAADAETVGGRYCEDCTVATVLGPDDYVSPLRGGVRPYALDPDHARAVWASMNQLVGERF